MNLKVNTNQTVKILPFLFFLLLTGLEALAQPAADSVVVVIQNVLLWDGLSDTATPNQAVLVVGNHIRQVGRTIVPPTGALRIDGKGHLLMPGLTDAHLHLMYNQSVGSLGDNLSAHWGYMSARAVKTAQNLLMLGFTTVRDMGGPVFGIKQAIDEGIIPGPRIYPSGAFVSQTSGHGDIRPRNDPNPNWTGGPAGLAQQQGWAYLADGRPQVLNAVRENLRQGATQIKMMAGGGISSVFDPLHTVQFTSDELLAGVEAAADWGTYVSVHAYYPEAIRRALLAGVKSIEHGHLIDEETMQLLRQKGAFLVPQSYWMDIPLQFSSNAAKLRLVQQGAARQMELAKKYGVRLAFGTDVFGKINNEQQAFQEFTSRVRWFRPVEVLRQATSVNAELFALTGRLNPYPDALGVIRPGAYADLLLYEGNPLDNIEIITRPEQTLKLIMKDGKIIKNTL